MLCFGISKSGKFHYYTKTMQHEMSTGCVFPPTPYIYYRESCWHRAIGGAIIHIRRGLVLLVQCNGQYQSLSERNSNNAVPLFYCVYR